MREQHRRWAVVFVVLVVAAAVGEFPRQSLAQNPADDGHSYIRIMIGDHVLTNLVINKEYQKGDNVRELIGEAIRQKIQVEGPAQLPTYRT